MLIYFDYIPILIYALLLTIVIEITASLVLGLRKKDLLNVLLVNTITNPLINCIHPLFLFKYGKSAQIICLIILEILVVLTEGLIYKKVLNYKKINGYSLSLILNILSYLAGLVINNFIF